MSGMIHIYCGDGKGKTTAAVGLCVRAAGKGIPVLFVQFLKDGTSGEVTVLKKIQGIETLCIEKNLGFYSKMNEDRKAEAREGYSQLLEDALALAVDGLLIKDKKKKRVKAPEIQKVNVAAPKNLRSIAAMTAAMAPAMEISAELAEGIINPEDLGLPLSPAAKEKEDGLVTGVLILDEVIAAYNNNLIHKENLVRFLKEKPVGLEVILTGREPAEELKELADYISFVEKRKHPYDKGILARNGIEK